MSSIYDFSAIDHKGKEVSLAQFKGKALLIVNTASECGFTSQYQGLRELRERHKKKLEVLAFPCNQFGGQEPGDDQAIAQFCDLQFNITFPLFSKVEVNGSEEHPLFSYLKSELPGVLGTKKIKWNFTKFLVDKNGRPVKRFAPKVKPLEIEKDLGKLI